MQAVLPDAIAFALLGAIESLLSAVVADGMTGRRHRSNCELVAQGYANIACGFFGGICATGTIARTATNVRAGGRTPFAGMLHSAFLLGFMLLAAPLVLAFIVNDGFFREKALLASAIVGLWALRCLRATLWQSPPAIGKTVSGLLAGICLVDLLAVADQPPHVSVWFLGCFVLALLCQRFVPAT